MHFHQIAIFPGKAGAYPLRVVAPNLAYIYQTRVEWTDNHFVLLLRPIHYDRKKFYSTSHRLELSHYGWKSLDGSCKMLLVQFPTEHERPHSQNFLLVTYEWAE